jgi:hypothetical protein
MSERDKFTVGVLRLCGSDQEVDSLSEIFRSESARLTGRLRRLGSVELESVKSDSGRFSCKKKRGLPILDRFSTFLAGESRHDKILILVGHFKEST